MTVEYGARRFAIVGSVVVASALFIFYSSVVAVAYPQITGNLGASSDQGTWIIDAFLLSAVIAIPLAPWLQARLGRRRYATFATLGFAAMTFLCGFATSPAMLIVLRFAQGAFGGGLAPLAQAILRDTLPAKELQRGQALFAVSVTFGGALAPYLGGLIADDLSWPWIFYVGVPAATVAGVVLARLLVDPGPPEPRPLDVIGFVFLIIALSSLMYLLVEGERWDWLDDEHNLLAAILAMGGFVAFPLWSLCKARAPIVDLRVMRRGNTAVACVLAAVFGFGLYGLFVLEPLSTQSVIGLTSTLSGILVTLQNLAQTALLMPITSLLAAKRVAPRVVLAAGFVTFALANFAIARVTTTTADFAAFLIPMVLGGIGPALIFAPLPAIAVEGLNGPHDVSTAAALFNLSRILGGSVGVAVVQALVHRRYAFHQDVLSGAVTLGAPMVAAFLRSGHPLDRLSAAIAEQSNALADADGFRAIAFIAICSLPFVLLLKANGRKDGTV